MAKNILVNTWQAGMARVDITPPLGVWMAGFGDRIQPAMGVHDPLYATALVLADGNQEVAIVSCDLLALDATDVQNIKELVAKQIDFNPVNILVHTTHTHSGPLACNNRYGPRDKTYNEILFRRIASAVILARQNLRPVRLTYGEATATIGVNRRQKRNEQVSIGNNLAGPVDNRVVVIGIWPANNESDRPYGLVIRAATHPVVWRGYQFGRDFPGCAITYLERALPGCSCLYLTGTAGDVNPLGMQNEDKNRLASQLGYTLAGGALQALAAGHELAWRSLVAVQHAVRVPLLPLPTVADLLKLRDQAKARIAASDNQAARLLVDGQLSWAEEALAIKQGASVASTSPAVPLEAEAFTAQLQAMIIGDLTLTALPFEVFTEYQAYADASSPTKHQLVVGCANGNYGYLPTIAAYAEGGYEVEQAYKYYGIQQMSAQGPAALMQGITELHNMVQG